MRFAAVVLLLLAPRSPALLITPTAMTFDGAVGGLNPPAKILTVKNEGDGHLDWTATTGDSWLTATPTSGRLRAGETQDVLVRPDITGLALGTRVGTLTIHDPQASNSPRSTEVTLRLSVAPVIGADPATLAFAAPFGGPAPASQALTIRNDGGGVLAWTLSDDATWLSASPVSGSLAPGGSTSVDVTASVAGLASGTHTGSITIDGAGATNAPKTVGVSIQVSAQPTISLAPSSISFSAPFGGPNPAAKTLTLENSGGGTLAWTSASGASWLSVSPASGSLGPGASTSLSLSVDVAGVADGVHGTTVTVTAAGASNSPRTAPVTLTVNEEPRIGLNPGAVNLRLTTGGGPATRAVSLTNGGAGTLAWTASSSASWLRVEPDSGSLGAASSEPLTLRIDPAGFGEGSRSASVTVRASGASNSPQTVPVSLEVVAQAPAEDRRAGYACGALGAEILLLAPFLLRRRRRR